MTPAVRFSHVTKQYRLGGGSASLRETLAGLPKRLLTGANGRTSQTLRALDDVSFEVASGEVLGLIGHNGAGKTTVLKLLSNVTRPASGAISVRGRVSALIELGAGFHPELTGRENIYLYGAILGLTRAEVAARFDRIVAFSELERFLDTPVKRYSSGMYVRLAFAVAIHVEPEVLLVDEVLAVGDMSFQRKCLDRLREIHSRGTTVIFVSHYMRALETLCDRALWLEQGRIRQIGSALPVIAAYGDDMNRTLAERGLAENDNPVRRGTGDVQLTSVRLLDAAGAEANRFRLGEALVVELGYRARRPVCQPSFDLALFASSGVRVCTATTRLSGCSPERLEGEGVVRCVFDPIPFVAGDYSITVAIFDQDDLLIFDQWFHAVRFVVASTLIGDTHWHLDQNEHGVVYLAPRWEL